MKSVVLQLWLLLLAITAGAQTETNLPSASKFDEYMETGMEVSGVSAPYYNDDGELVARLHGGHAKILEGGRAEVTNLRIDVFQEGEVFATVFAPKCFTSVKEEGGQKTLEVVSEGDVLLDMEEMTISGRGFHFSSEDGRFEILEDAKVLVKESARDIEGIDL